MEKSTVTQVKARRSVEWPKLGFAISAGETKDLPEDKAAQVIILAHPAIVPIAGKAETVAKPKRGVN